MSLDVTLTSSKPTQKVCECCGSTYEVTEGLYSSNITHNLNLMAEAAGIYKALWRPAEQFPNQKKPIKAGQLIPLLEEGLAKLLAKPDYYKQFDAKNGWGEYGNLVSFVQKYLAACKEFPDAIVEVSR